MYRVLISIYFLCSICYQSQAQGFDAELSAGANFSQVDGDGFNGYHQTGLRAGIAIIPYQNEKNNARVSLLYAQSGSKIPRSQSTTHPSGSLRLDNIGMSLEYSFSDFISKRLNRPLVSVIPGLAVYRIFNVSSTHLSYLDDISKFKVWQMAISVTGSVALGKKVDLRCGFERNLTPLYRLDLSSPFSHHEVKLFTLIAYKLK